jgi:hypothetical protein
MRRAILVLLVILASAGWLPGDAVTFLVGRADRVETVQVTMEEFPVPVYEILDAGTPTARQLEIRKKWFKQSTNES